MNASFFNKHPLELMDVHTIAHGDFNSDVTSSRFNASLYDKTMLHIRCPAASAGDDISILTRQADAASSGNTKALNFSEIFYKVDGADQWTKLELTTATNDLDTGSTGETVDDLAADSVVADFLVVFRNDDFDGANGYKYLEYFNEGDDLSNARVCVVEAIGVGPRYSKAIPLDPT